RGQDGVRDGRLLDHRAGRLHVPAPGGRTGRRRRRGTESLRARRRFGRGLLGQRLRSLHEPRLEPVASEGRHPQRADRGGRQLPEGARAVPPAGHRLPAVHGFPAPSRPEAVTRVASVESLSELTHLTGDERRQIAIGAASVFERTAFALAGKASRTDAFAPTEQALGVLRAWIQAFSPGDPEAFERRLTWDDLSMTDVARALSEPPIAIVEPDWLVHIDAIAGA